MRRWVIKWLPRWFPGNANTGVVKLQCRINFCIVSTLFNSCLALLQLKKGAMLSVVVPAYSS